MSDPLPTQQDPLASHLLDLHAVDAGVWFRVRDDQFLVARIDNPRVAKLRAEWLAMNGLPASAAIPADRVGEWKAHVFARGILLGAKFAKMPDRPYTHDIGERIATDPALVDLFDTLMVKANGDWTAESLRREAILGNCVPFSPGRTSSAETSTP